MMRKAIRTFLVSSLVILGGVGLAVAGCGADHGAKAAKNEGESKAQGDIVATAVANGSFKTLVAAVEAAGLVETLQSDGPFTVFAPTDDAFARLPEGTVEGLLADPDKLREILLYHVVPGKVTSAKVAGLDSAATAQGSTIDIRVEDGNVRINEASVIAADVETSNGVIHVIDQVILPRG
jgi:uncharacterized surface protein with fasciclin (FAS1) repeats